MCTNPHFVDRVGFFVPCGQCMSCRISRAREWSERLVHESQYWDSCVFVTLTYRSTIRPYSVSRKEVQDFFKRLRYEVDGRFLKYYASGEYGEKLGGAHYHGIIFGLKSCGECYCCSKDARKRGRAPAVGTDCYALCEAWTAGFVHVSGVGPESCGYVAKYVTKFDSRELQGRERPFSLKSQGLGERWLRDNIDSCWSRNGFLKKGRIVSLPRYYVKLVDGIMGPPAGWMLGRIRWRAMRDLKVEGDYVMMSRKGVFHHGLELGKCRKQRDRNVRAKVVVG